LNAVDHWVDDLLRNPELVNKLIRFSPEDAEDVAYKLDAPLEPFSPTAKK
jgi:hypothetical protein